MRVIVDGHRPVMLTVLPRQRNARHPYQLCIMLALILIAVSQLWMEAPPGSAVRLLNQAQLEKLSWLMILGGASGLLAAVIPERMVRWGGPGKYIEFDATWVRLIVEAACHSLLLFVWTSYFVVIIKAVGLYSGLSLGVGLVAFLGVAAAWRFTQIAATAIRAVHPPDSGLVGADVLDRDA